MGLITKEVEMVWNGRNKKHYISKGYIFTHINDVFTVKVCDMLPSSNYKLLVQCDEIGCDTPPMLTSMNSYNRCLRDGKYYCKKCAYKKYAKINEIKSRLKNGMSFQQWCLNSNRIDILSRWDYSLNNIDPSDITYGTKKKYYFKCPKNIHNSELKKINSITTGQEGSIQCNKCNSFSQWGINILGEDFLEKYWDYEKNINIDPWKLSYASKIKIWIKCQNKDFHKSYFVHPANFILRKSRCPRCSEEKSESFLQEKVRLYLNEFNYKILHEHHCTICPVNPKTSHNMPFDNEVKELKLIIEVHGIQHYKEGTGQFSKNGLHKRKLYDRYKKMCALSSGYEYLEIPYFTDNEDETWKTLIDEKIKYIIGKGVI